LTFYLDTSVLVAALTAEAQSRRMQAWLTEQEPGGLAISEWVATEFSAALSVKLRSGRIDATDRADALAVFARLRTEALTVLPVSELQFRTAARFADQHAQGLRAGDALHLAICSDHGATLCTLDRRQGEAGAALGVKTTLL
jgi:predicted nucleic acid-binding protein